MHKICRHISKCIKLACFIQLYQEMRVYHLLIKAKNLTESFHKVHNLSQFSGLGNH